MMRCNKLLRQSLIVMMIACAFLFISACTTTSSVSDVVDTQEEVVTDAAPTDDAAPTGVNAPQPSIRASVSRFYYNGFDSIEGSFLNWDVRVAETDSELAQLDVYMRKYSEDSCREPAKVFDASKSTLIETRVFGSTQLSTQAIQYLPSETNVVDFYELEDGTDGSDPDNDSTAKPKFENGFYLISAQTTSPTGNTAVDSVCVELNNENRDPIIIFDVEGKSAEDANGNLWYGNGDVKVSARTRFSDDEVECTSFPFNAVSTVEDGVLVYEKADNSGSERFDFIQCSVEGAFADLSLNIDNVAPASVDEILVNKDGSDDTIPVAVTAGSYYSSDATFSTSAFDSGVGADSSVVLHAYRAGNISAAGLLAKNVSSGADIPESEAGSDVVLRTVTVKDLLGNAAGNVVKINSPAFAIDKTAPKLSDIRVNGVTFDGDPVSLDGFKHTGATAADSDYTGVTNGLLSYQAIGGGPFLAPITEFKWSVSINGTDCELDNNVVTGSPASRLYTINVADIVAACKSGANLKQSSNIAVSVVAVDAACNESEAFTATYTYDFGKPVAKAIGDEDVELVAGASSTIGYQVTDGIGVGRALVTASNGTTTIVISNSQFSGDKTKEVSEVTVTALAGYEYFVTPYDVNGNVGITSNLANEVEQGKKDDVAPTVSASIKPSATIVKGNTATIVAEVAEQTPTGIVASGIANVFVYRVNSSNTLVLVGKATENNDGDYELGVSTAKVGSVNYAVIAIDANGNASNPATTTLTVTN